MAQNSMRKNCVSFPEVKPELLEQWDWELNNGIDPYTVPHGSTKKYYWKCLNDERHPSFLASVDGRTRKLVHDKNHGCPVCANRKVIKGINDLASQCPELAREWNYEKNGNLSPEDVPYSSQKRVWWKCPKDGYEWETTIYNRSIEGHKCGVCAGNTILEGYNDVATIRPDIMKWIPPHLNPQVNYSTLGPYSETPLYFQCQKYEEHIWESSLANHSKSICCPYCNGRKVLAGFNDLATTHPSLIEEWDHERNDVLPTEISAGSNKRVYWICKHHPEHRWQAQVWARTQGSGCPKCNHHSSFVEMFILFAFRFVLGEKQVLHRDKALIGKELDIVIPSLKLAIEPGNWYWHQNKKNEDDIKRYWCRNKGYQLYVIYDSWTRDYELTSKPTGLLRYCDFFVPEYMGEQENRQQLISVVKRIMNDYNISYDNIDWDIIGEQAQNAARQPVLEENSLKAKCPEKLDDWDYNKNIILPSEISSCDHRKQVWWTCPNGHSYQTTVKSKKVGECHVCNEQIIVPGINHISDIISNIEDIWDTENNNNNLLYIKNVGKEHRNHSKVTHWICPHCEHHFSRYISVLLHGKSKKHNACPKCGGQIAIIKNLPNDSSNTEHKHEEHCENDDSNCKCHCDGCQCNEK